MKSYSLFLGIWGLFLCSACTIVVPPNEAQSEKAQPEKVQSDNVQPDNPNSSSDGLVGIYKGSLTLPKSAASNFVLTIEQVEGNKVKGYNVAAGNNRPVSGFVEKQGDNTYILTLNESGNDKTDGSFNIRLIKQGSSYEGSGTWTGYKNNTKADIKLSDKF